MAMLRLAARLTSDDKRAEISTSRLFYAAVVTGSLASTGTNTTLSGPAVSLPPDHYAGRPGSYAETVARAIIDDPELVGNFHSRLSPLFQLEPIGAAQGGCATVGSPRTPLGSSRTPRLGGH
jgi:hypothetical protein